MLIEVRRVIENDACSPLVRVALELRMAVRKAFELYDMAGLATIVGHVTELELLALMFFVAGRAEDSIIDMVSDWQYAIAKARYE